MAAFLYYVPQSDNGAEPTVESLAALGFPHAAELGGVRSCSAGPDGKSGHTFVLKPTGVPGSAPPAPGYYPQQQTWIKNGAWWIGQVNGSPPSELDLRRATQIRGHNVKLLDGSDWLVPVARLMDGPTILPRLYAIGADGQPSREVLPRYVDLWHDSGRVWNDLKAMWDTEAPPDHRLTETEYVAIAARALAINYRVSEFELMLLRLVSDEEVIAVCRMLIDWPTIELRLKEAAAERAVGQKKTADGVEPSTELSSPTLAA